MKQLLTIIAVISLLSTGCNKSNPAPPSNNNSNNNNDYYFTAKIDGVDFSADMNSSNTYANVPHNGLLTISAALTTVTDGFFLGNISNYNGAGTYTIGKGGNGSYIRYTSGSVGAGTYSAWKAEEPGSTTTGTIVITKDDATVIEGTVQFDGYSEEKKTTKKITDGKFRMKKS